jgi:outer membrane immunogenic protein
MLTGAAAVAGISGANAADMSVLKAPPPPPAASWAGWYIGGQIGAALVEINRYDADFGTLQESSGKKSVWTGGGQIGYNFQRGNFVYGLEVDASTGSKQKFLTDCSDCGEKSNRLGWVATARGRAGIALQDTFLYITSGVAVASITTKTFDDIQYSHTKTRFGWVAGAGVEHMLTRNWTLGTEVLFMDLGSKTYSTEKANDARRRVSGQITTVRTRLNYKF